MCGDSDGVAERVIGFIIITYSKSLGGQRQKGFFLPFTQKKKKKSV